MAGTAKSNPGAYLNYAALLKTDGGVKTTKELDRPAARRKPILPEYFHLVYKRDQKADGETPNHARVQMSGGGITEEELWGSLN